MEYEIYIPYCIRILVFARMHAIGIRCILTCRFPVSEKEIGKRLVVGPRMYSLRTARHFIARMYPLRNKNKDLSIRRDWQYRISSLKGLLTQVKEANLNWLKPIHPMAMNPHEPTDDDPVGHATVFNSTDSMPPNVCREPELARQAKRIQPLLNIDRSIYLKAPSERSKGCLSA